MQDDGSEVYSIKTSKRFIVVLSSILLAFFLTALVCFTFFYFEGLLIIIFLAQLIVFSLGAASVIVYSLIPLFYKVQNLAHDITKLVFLSETNTPTDEFSLINRTSVVISKGEAVYISLESHSANDEYAVINRVRNYWYIERVSEARSIGLKRAGEQYVYKLKPSMSYRLYINDIIYIENERLLVI